MRFIDDNAKINQEDVSDDQEDMVENAEVS